MSAAVETQATRPWLWLAPVLGLAVLVVLALAEGVGALAAGWLAGWLFSLGLCVGASGWLMIHAVVGGRWIGAGGHVLALLAALTPFAALAGLPMLAVLPQLYPWWPGEDAARGIFYLNADGFLIRGAIILTGWSVIGIIAARMGRGLAVAGLIFHGFAVSFAGLDWVLSRDPDFGSTTFGALLAVLQLALALNVAALALRQDEPRAVADWGGLMLACVLGIFYFAAMQFIVSWSGNLPGKAAWYLARLAGAGQAVLILAFLAGAVIPFLALLPSRWRSNAALLRPIAASALTGGLLYLVWMCAPGQHVLSLAVALAIVALLTGLAAALRQMTRGGARGTM